MRDLLAENIKIEFAGKLPVGKYVFVLTGISLFEDAVAYNEHMPEALAKAVRNKEKAALTDDQKRQVEALPAPGTFDDGRPYPFYQNKTIFNFAEKNSGTKARVEMFGGPGMTTALKEFIERATGANLAEHVGKGLSSVISAGQEFSGVIVAARKGDFTNLDPKTVRRVDLPPLKDDSNISAPTNASGFTDTEEALLTYLEGAGKGMAETAIADLYKKGININGVSLTDFAKVVTAWNNLKPKLASYVDASGNILIVRK